jgi:hypothetical protein
MGGSSDRKSENFRGLAQMAGGVAAYTKAME